jgi:UDP-N-acetylglucosamine acyltransferase
MSIHPTAIIHPGASIGNDCEIGPFCTIGEHVTLGDGCRLISHVVIDGHTTLGKLNLIFPFVSIGLRTQDLKWKGGVTYTRIGDHNTIRECVTIHSATNEGDATTIGSHNNILASSHIAHDVQMGDHIIVSMAAVAGHVVIEDKALLGGMSGIHQFCRIGTMAIVGGCTKIAQDVAPYMLVEGNPAVTRAINKIGLERNGATEEAQAALRQAHRILYRDGLTTPNALAKIETELPPLPELTKLVAFVRSSERGIIR